MRKRGSSGKFKEIRNTVKHRSAQFVHFNSVYFSKRNCLDIVSKFKYKLRALLNYSTDLGDRILFNNNAKQLIYSSSSLSVKEKNRRDGSFQRVRESATKSSAPLKLLCNHCCLLCYIQDFILAKNPDAPTHSYTYACMRY